MFHVEQNPCSEINSQMVLFAKGVKELGLPLTEEIEGKFSVYLTKLLQWNRRLNLVSSRDEQRIVERHFLESLGLLSVIDFPTKGWVLDLGTGAGFPGLPLKILRPDLVLTLLDSTRKKTLFLKDVVRTLGLKEVAIIWARAEQINEHRQYRGKYDIVLARAVASLEKLVDWGFPFLRRDPNGQRGMLVIMKGSTFAEELHRLQRRQRHKIVVRLIDYPKNRAENRKILVIQPKM